MYTFLHLPKSTYFNIFQIFESLIAGAFFSLGWVLALLRKETQNSLMVGKLDGGNSKIFDVHPEPWG